MNKFIKKLILLIFTPFILILFIVILWDPFKVFFNYKDFYKNNRITNNREQVCLTLFNRRDFKNIHNIIIGSSRSQAFKTSDWMFHLGGNKYNYFHWDGNGMGLYRAANAIKYLSNKTNKIDNILLIVDTDFFLELSNPKEFLIIQPPSVSNQSYIYFYSRFLKASLDYKFIFSNFIYYVFYYIFLLQ